MIFAKTPIDDEDDETLRLAGEGQPATLRAQVRAVTRREHLIRGLVRWRRRVAKQSDVAVVMGTSQSALARLERGGTDPRMSTLERYAASIGVEIGWQLTVDRDVLAHSPHLAHPGAPQLDLPERLLRLREVHQVLNERMAAEGLAARRAAEHCTEEDRVRLGEALSRLFEIHEKVLTREEADAFGAADMALHLAIAAVSRDPALRERIEELQRHCGRLLDGMRPVPRERQVPLRAAVVDAVTRNQPEAAERAMTAVLEATGVDVFHEQRLDLARARPLMQSFFLTRLGSECLAARLAAERATGEDITRLGEAFESFRAVSLRDPQEPHAPAALRTADREFHRAVAAAGHDDDVYEMATRAHGRHVEFLRSVGDDAQGVDRAMVFEHRAVLDAIREGDPAKAEGAMRQHIDNSRASALLRLTLDDATWSEQEEVVDSAAVAASSG